MVAGSHQVSAQTRSALLQTPHEWLLSTRRGAYTTAFVREGRLLINWQKHVERLELSLRAMHTALTGFYDAYYTWLKGVQAPESTVLQQLLSRPIRDALQQSKNIHKACSDLMLMIVMVPEPAQPSGLDVRVRAFPCGPAGSSPAGAAIILGGPRAVPVGKDSGWVAERRPLEQQKGDAAEVLLSTQGGRLLEGLVTNLFIVAGSNGAGYAPVLWTAGMEDGVVWGTVRAAVLEAAKQLGIAVREEAPSMHERHTWREAFVTNGLRLVQPLSSISCSPDNVWGHAPWKVDFPTAPGPITAALTAALLALLPAVDIAEL